MIAGALDAVDGFIAKRLIRARAQASLDPLADKVLLVSVYVTSASPAAWTWLVVLVVFRDIMIVGGFLLIQAIAAVPKPFHRCSSVRSTPRPSRAGRVCPGPPRPSAPMPAWWISS